MEYSKLFTTIASQGFNLECQLEPSIGGLNSMAGIRQITLQLVVVQQFVDGTAQFIIGEIKRVQTNAEPGLVQALRVVELVHEVGQHNHGLQYNNNVNCQMNHSVE